MNNPYAQLEQARRRREQIQENSARAATSFVTLRSKGVGDNLLPAPVEFDTPFFHEPSVVSGFHLEVRPSIEIYTLPRVSSGVYRWVKTNRGFYTGAYIYLAVDLERRDGTSVIPEDVANVAVVHHLQFFAISYKPLGGQASAEAQDALVTPLTPPFTP